MEATSLAAECCLPVSQHFLPKFPYNMAVEKYYSQLTVACQNKQHNKPHQQHTLQAI